MEKIYLCLAHMSGLESVYIQEAIDRNWVTPLGFNVDAFEEDIKRFVDVKKEVAVVSSGTAAIHLALTCLGVGRGDEVICQSFTFIASANPAVYLGATPVFVDSEPDTWNMSPSLLDTAIQDRIRKTGRKPKAIIMVHLFGMPAKIDEIMEVARRYDIPVVEDAAEAMGSMYKNRHCGTFGHYGIFSFNGNKMITTSGGGALICPDMAAKEKALFYATQAREPKPYYQHEVSGYNYRMSNICAGIGRGQMTVLENHVEHHRKVCRWYAELLGDIKGVSVHVNPTADSDSNFWLSSILIDEDVFGADIEKVRLHLESQDIECRRLWKPLHLQPVFKDAPRYVNGISEMLFGKGLCLPSGPYVGREQVERIVKEILSCSEN
jgi:dTDP-4-amino-4,6-dideoxygalactose transaminase